MTTAALHTVMVFLPNLSIPKIANENAARLHSLATTHVPRAHKYSLHKYCGVDGCVPTATRTTEVPVMKTNSLPLKAPREEN